MAVLTLSGSTRHIFPAKKKDPSCDESFFLVELVRDNWHRLTQEQGRWKNILAVDWSRHKNKDVLNGYHPRP